MHTCRAEEGEGDSSVLGPCSCSSRTKQTNENRDQWGRMKVGKTKSYIYSSPFVPVAPKLFLKPGATPLSPPVLITPFLQGKNNPPEHPTARYGVC